MKKVLVSILLTLFATGSFALPLDPDLDGIGVYFDPCACVNCVQLDEGQHLVYLVITHPTSPEGVGGFEAAVWAEGPIFILSWTFMGDVINVGTKPNEIILGVAQPLINPFTYPAVVVANMEILITDTATPVDFYIDGIYFHSLEDKQPAYLDGSDYNIIKKLQQSTGGRDFPVATINGECAVATENQTLDQVKALFR